MATPEEMDALRRRADDLLDRRLDKIEKSIEKFEDMLDKLATKLEAYDRHAIDSRLESDKRLKALEDKQKHLFELLGVDETTGRATPNGIVEWATHITGSWGLLKWTLTTVAAFLGWWALGTGTFSKILQFFSTTPPPHP